MNLKLIGFLSSVLVDDLRPVIKNHFKSHELVANAHLNNYPRTPQFWIFYYLPNDIVVNQSIN